MRIFVVGVGNLGAAVVRSLQRSHAHYDIVLVERDAKDREALLAHYGCSVVEQLDSDHRVGSGDLLVLTVKPQDAAVACAMIAPHLDESAVVLSMMAGVSIETLGALLKTRKIARAMPNLGASIGESATAYFCNASLLSHETIGVEAVLSALGRCWRIEREDLLDGLTAVAGSGPAYLCWLAEHVEKTAIEFGLSKEDAHAVVLQTFRGTMLYLEQSGLTFAELRAQVTSPQGTTAAAMSILKERAADKAVTDAVAAARKRASELGVIKN